jgi:glycerophosphoryl diester phosphodiesterase
MAHEGQEIEWKRPVLIAHRAGNDLDQMRAAVAAGVDLIETDVWLARGQLELRHEKTAGPLPIWWDRWSLARRPARALQLKDLLDAMPEEVVPFIDLKGSNQRLPNRIVNALAEQAAERPVAVCTQNWGLLEPLLDIPSMTVFYSVGNPKLLEQLPAELRRVGPRGISIHSRLLNAETVRTLKEVATLVIPWHIVSEAQLRQLLAWGVDGINADDLDLLRRLAEERTHQR